MSIEREPRSGYSPPKPISVNFARLRVVDAQAVDLDAAEVGDELPAEEDVAALADADQPQLAELVLVLAGEPGLDRGSVSACSPVVDVVPGMLTSRARASTRASHRLAADVAEVGLQAQLGEQRETCRRCCRSAAAVGYAPPLSP